MCDPFPETQPFVDKLFEAILNKSYLPQSEQPSSVAKIEKDEQKKDEVIFFSEFKLPCELCTGAVYLRKYGIAFKIVG